MQTPEQRRSSAQLRLPLAFACWIVLSGLAAGDSSTSLELAGALEKAAQSPRPYLTLLREGMSMGDFKVGRAEIEEALDLARGQSPEEGFERLQQLLGLVNSLHIDGSDMSLELARGTTLRTPGGLLRLKPNVTLKIKDGDTLQADQGISLAEGERGPFVPLQSIEYEIGRDGRPVAVVSGGYGFLRKSRVEPLTHTDGDSRRGSSPAGKGRGIVGALEGLGAKR